MVRLFQGRNEQFQFVPDRVSSQKHQTEYVLRVEPYQGEAPAPLPSPNNNNNGAAAALLLHSLEPWVSTPFRVQNRRPAPSAQRSS